MNRSDIIAEARSWIGTPYHHQAALKGVGCDCIGLSLTLCQPNRASLTSWRFFYAQMEEACAI